MSRLPLILALLAITPLAHAWGVLPDPAWASDTTVSVLYELHDDVATGPLISSATLTATAQNPWSLTTPRTISTAPFAGSGRNVVLIAKAKRGTVESVVVSLPPTGFSLAPPLVSHANGACDPVWCRPGGDSESAS